MKIEAESQSSTQGHEVATFFDANAIRDHGTLNRIENAPLIFPGAAFTACLSHPPIAVSGDHTWNCPRARRSTLGFSESTWENYAVFGQRVAIGRGCDIQSIITRKGLRCHFGRTIPVHDCPGATIYNELPLMTRIWFTKAS